MFCIRYLTYLRYNREKTRKKRIVGEGGTYLKVGKRDESYSYIWFIRRGKYLTM